LRIAAAVVGAEILMGRARRIRRRLLVANEVARHRPQGRPTARVVGEGAALRARLIAVALAVLPSDRVDDRALARRGGPIFDGAARGRRLLAWHDGNDGAASSV